MEKNFEALNFERMRKAQAFRVISSCGKHEWKFKYDNNRNLLVCPPGNQRYTTVVYPATTLAAIAKGKEVFEMVVKPLPKVEGDAKIEPMQVMFQIGTPCIGF